MVARDDATGLLAELGRRGCKQTGDPTAAQVAERLLAADLRRMRDHERRDATASR